MHDGTQGGQERQNGASDRGPQANKQEYSYNPGQRIQHRWPNQGTVAQCHHCVRSQSDADSQPEQEESQAGRTVGESGEKSAHNIIRLRTR